MRKNTRVFVVILLLTGFFAGNSVVGMCIPMLAELISVTHSKMGSDCCNTLVESNYLGEDSDLSTSNSGCHCCGCGLQTEESSLPIDQPNYAVITTQVIELLSTWKTLNSIVVASIIPENWVIEAKIANLLPHTEALFLEFNNPPVFILHQALLN